MKVFLAADGSAGLKVAKAIIAEGYVLRAVAAPETEANKALLKFCSSIGGALFSEKIVTGTSAVEWLKNEQIDVVLSIHTSHIMCDEFIEAPKLGSFNLHPGPLPAYAGRNPVSWALYHGETEHGATLHRITTRIDAGPIVAQSRFAIEPEDTALTLMAKTSNSGVSLVREFLKKLAAGENILETSQDTAKRRYFNARVPQGGEIDWSKSAHEIVNFVRGADFGPFPSPWGYPTFVARGKTYRLIKARVSDLPREANPGSIYELGEFPLGNASDRMVEMLSIDPPEID